MKTIYIIYWGIGLYFLQTDMLLHAIWLRDGIELLTSHFIRSCLLALIFIIVFSKLWNVYRMYNARSEEYVTTCNSSLVFYFHFNTLQLISLKKSYDGVIIYITMRCKSETPDKMSNNLCNFKIIWLCIKQLF